MLKKDTLVANVGVERARNEPDEVVRRAQKKN